jgi:hypothetical protein
MKRLERSRMKLGVLAEVGILKFPQENYLCHFSLVAILSKVSDLAEYS